MTATQIFTAFAGILALVGAYFYFFGIDPETKRQLERKALKTMGENKMSYLAKGSSIIVIQSCYTLTFSRSDQQDSYVGPRKPPATQKGSR
jgi:preprotein translocase subunit YajC